jgi:GT2 family glycosyltransferase
MQVEIILPVFNASDDLRRCLDALAGRLPARASLQIVDDASSDPSIATMLLSHPLALRPGVRIVRNLRNLGFVRSVNTAMARTTSDVVLLNSDTIVTHGWLDRILACAHSDPAIATITPFSNNAEICSFPEFCRVNPVPSDPEAFAHATARAGPPCYPDLPTGVGFCMFIRREAWNVVGAFDAVAFGRGYGEENDWCFRAAAQGWRNVLCDDAYVVHVGGMSFADTGHRPGGGQMDKLLALHPHYNEVIADFIRRDPIAPRRHAVLSALIDGASILDD